MAGQWGYNKDNLHKKTKINENKKNKKTGKIEKEHIFFNTTVDPNSRRYYSFSIKDHYDKASRARTFPLFETFLDKTIKTQRARENKILTEAGFEIGAEGFKKFEDAFSNFSTNSLDILSNLTVDFLVKEEGSYKPRKALSEESINNIYKLIGEKVSGMCDDLDKDIKTQIESEIKNNRISGLIFAPDSSTGLRFVPPDSKIEEGKKIYKTTLEKQLNQRLAGIRGMINEYTDAQAVKQSIESIDGKFLSTIISGRKTTKAGKSVKADSRVGDINISSKFYTLNIGSETGTPITLHGSTLQGIGEYLGNYNGFTAEQVDNFIFNFVNIYNFAVSGGIEKSKDRNSINHYSLEEFPMYDNIITAVQNAAAIWIGTNILSNKSSSLFKGDNVIFNQVDFLVINKRILPVSKVLEYIRDNTKAIDIHFYSRRVMDPMDVYKNKLAAGKKEDKSTKKDKNSFNYPESILRLGRQYGQAAAAASAHVKFMYILDSIK